MAIIAGALLAGGWQVVGRAFLQVVNPQIVVISGGSENRFGHSHQEALRRMAKIGAMTLRTDESGTIEFVNDERQIWFISSMTNRVLC